MVKHRAGRGLGHAPAGDHQGNLAALGGRHLLDRAPDIGGERRAGVEEHVEVTEIEAAQLRIVPHRLHGERVRDGQVDRQRTGMHPEILQRSLEQLSGRLPVVEIEAAAVRQHHVEVGVAGEHMVPGGPAQDLVRLAAEQGKAGEILRLVDGQHPLGLGHALGVGHGARDEEDLGERVRPHPGESRFGVRGGVSLQDVGERRDTGAIAAARDPVHAVEDVEPERRPVGLRVGGVDHRRAHLAGAVEQSRPRLGQEGVLLGQRHQGSADGLRRERQDRVIDRGSRQHDDRAAMPDPPRKESFRRGAHPLGHFRVGDLAPAVAAPLRDEDALRRFPGPAVQPVDGRARDRTEVETRPQDHRPVGTFLPADGMGLDLRRSAHFPFPSAGP